MRSKVLVTPRSFKLDSVAITLLQEAGFEIRWNPHNRPLTEKELLHELTDVEGIIIGVDPLTARVINEAKSLRVISKYGVGLDNIDISAATARGILVTVTPGANAISVAELTIGLMLSVARQIPLADKLVREGSWPRVVGHELYGKVLGLVGMGRIGREVAKRAYAFGMRILAFDKVQDKEFAECYNVEYTDLDDLLARSDFVSIHLPLDDSTRNLLDEGRLRKMKPEAFLINTSRGGILDEKALVRALTCGWIAGAALDVYAEEPPTDLELKRLSNVVLTPHMGAHTQEAISRMAQQAARNLIDALKGCVNPDVVVNPEVLRR